jgi:hypothetical protein
MRRHLSAYVFAIGLFAPGIDCQAAEMWSSGLLELPPPNGIFLFAGQFTTVGIGASLLPINPWHENNYLAGGAYERDFLQRGGFAVGGEVGVAQRFGMGSSTEVWAGLNVRYTALVFLNSVRIIPGITVGFSAINKPLGTEAERQAERNGDARLLGYLGPELAVSFVGLPNLEFVYRLQHRSGANGVFGKMAEGANANIVGIRFRF